MEKPELHFLQVIDWQFFCHLTFKQERLPERVRLSIFFAWVRTICGWHRVHFKRLVWCLRQERGETFGRRHFHSLISGLPRHTIHEDTCFAMKNQWEKVGGGMARVNLYDPTLNGEGYILKCLGMTTDPGDVYESSKFGSGAAEVICSESVYRIAGANLHGRRQGHTPLSTAQREQPLDKPRCGPAEGSSRETTTARPGGIPQQ